MNDSGNKGVGSRFQMNDRVESCAPRRSVREDVRGSVRPTRAKLRPFAQPNRLMKERQKHPRMAAILRSTAVSAELIAPGASVRQRKIEDWLSHGVRPYVQPD